MMSWLFAFAFAISSPDFETIQNQVLYAKEDLQLDNGENLSLQTLKEEKFLLISIYTSCLHTCSIITKSLKESIQAIEPKPKVLVYSFDPKESLSNLQNYRKKFDLDQNWIIGTHLNLSAKEKFLQKIDFRYFSISKTDFEHPNLVYLIGKNLKIHSYVMGAIFTTKDIERAIKEIDTFGISLYIFAIACLGFLISIFIFAFLVSKRKKRSQ